MVFHGCCFGVCVVGWASTYFLVGFGFGFWVGFWFGGFLVCLDFGLPGFWLIFRFCLVSFQCVVMWYLTVGLRKLEV